MRKFFYAAMSGVMAIAISNTSIAQTSMPAAGPATSETEALSLLNLDFPGMESVKSAAAHGDMAAAKQAYLDFRRNQSTARLPRDIPLPTVTGQSDPVAEEICRHIIRNGYIFEPRSADMGQDFNWTLNPIAQDSPSYTQEWTWCVVSRMHFWATLTEAYTRTGNEKYAREWVAQMLDFAAKNPVNVQPRPGEASLWRTLDSAIRVQYTWASSYFRCLHSPAFTPDAQWVYLRLMQDHAKLLRDGLTPGRTGNWVTTECSGLFAIGTLFPEFKQAAEWRKIAIDRLIFEANRAVPPDGFEAELTPNYHFVTLDGYILPVELARRNGITLPPEFETKMLSMYRAGVLVMDQSGKMPPVNDSGVIDAVKRAKQGMNLLGRDPMLLWAVTGGKEGQQPPLSVELPYAGFYVMRSGWKRNDTYLFFRGGPPGIAHEHQDMLSIILRAGDRTLLFDPGVYSYDHSDWRRYSINTPSHNTVIVDGKWQNRPVNKPPVTQPVQNPWITTPLFDYVSATYDQGYQQNEYDAKRQYGPQRWVGEVDRSVAHTRHVLFIKPRGVLVLDVLSGSGEHTYDAHFHVDAPSAHQDAATQTVTSDNPSGMQLSLYPLDRSNLSTDIVVGQMDPLLGWFPGGSDQEHRPIPTVRFRKKQAAPSVIATLLMAHEGAAPAVEAKELDINADLWSQQIQTPEEKLTVVLAKDQKPHVFQIPTASKSVIDADAAGLVLRQSPDDTKISVGVWGAQKLETPVCGFRSESPVSILAVKAEGKLYVYNAGQENASLMLTQPWSRSIAIPAGKWILVTANGVVDHQVPELD